MKYSVVIPVYNVEKFLQECIKSVLEQTYSDFELILVDDGSADKSAEICDEYQKKDGRIKVIHQKNGGVVKARQTGVENASGEYLVFVDGDDKIESDCLETINKVSNVDVIRFGYICETKESIEKHFMPERKGFYDKNDIVKEIYPRLIQTQDAKYFSPSVWAGAFRKELFEANMLKNTRLAIGEDGACVMPCVYNAESMYILEECLYFYRLNISSATKGRKVFQWDVPEIISNHLTRKINMSEYNFQEQLYRKIVHELFSVVVSQFYRNEKTSIIKKDIKKQLSFPLYDEAIRKAKFRHSKRAVLMHLALKHKWLFLIKIYSRIK